LFVYRHGNHFVLDIGCANGGFYAVADWGNLSVRPKRMQLQCFLAHKRPAMPGNGKSSKGRLPQKGQNRGAELADPRGFFAVLQVGQSGLREIWESGIVSLQARRKTRCMQQYIIQENIPRIDWAI
jgi:hypothetical protein